MTLFVFVLSILVISIFQCEIIASDNYTFEPPNLKTVLFRETDLLSRCWSSEEVSLLLNRRVLQDLVPRKIPRNLTLLLKYLKNIEDMSLKVPPGMNRTLVLLAIADVIGGYLQAIVIPIANEAYYAGNVDYQTVAKLHEMLDRWRWYLSTDGSTWSQECDMRKIPTKVALIDIIMHDKESACEELYVSGPKPNETDYLGTETVISEHSRIPIPYLDNNVMPNAVALPFKKRNLYSLSDPKAAYMLVKYYSLSMRCLSGSSPNDILSFNTHFHIWIASKVVPHLHDQDRWYPAFGAVMRVVETIKQKGLATANPVFVEPLSDDHHDAALNANLNIAEPTDEHWGQVSKYFHILNNPYALLIMFGLFILFLSLFCCIIIYCCLRFRRKEKKPLLFVEDSDDSILKNMVVSLYCGLKDTLTGSKTKLDPEYVEKHVPQDKKRNRESDYDRTNLIQYPVNTPEDSDTTQSITSDSGEEASVASRNE